MARSPGTSARTQRLIAGVATVLVVAIAVAIAFGRVFEGDGPTSGCSWPASLSAVIACGARAPEPRCSRRSRAPRRLASRSACSCSPRPRGTACPTLETAPRVARRGGTGRRAGAGAGRALTAARPRSMLAGDRRRLGRRVLLPRARVPCRQPLLALLPPIALVGVRRHGARGVHPSDLRVALPGRGARRCCSPTRSARVQGWGPVWTGPGTSRAARRGDRPRGATGRRRGGGGRRGRPVPAPRLRLARRDRSLASATTTDRVRIDPLVSMQGEPGAERPTRSSRVRVGPTSAGTGGWLALRGTSTAALEPRSRTPTDPRGRARRRPTRRSRSRAPARRPWSDVHGRERPRGSLAARSPIRHARSTSRLDGMRWDARGRHRHARWPARCRRSLPGHVRRRGATDARGAGDGDVPALAGPTEHVAGRSTRRPAAGDPATIAERGREGAANDYDRIIAIQDHLTERASEFTYDTDVPRRRERPARCSSSSRGPSAGSASSSRARWR